MAESQPFVKPLHVFLHYLYPSAMQYVSSTRRTVSLSVCELCAPQGHMAPYRWAGKATRPGRRAYIKHPSLKSIAVVDNRGLTPPD
jgi:hypothetical protein